MVLVDEGDLGCGATLNDQQIVAPNSEVRVDRSSDELAPVVLERCACVGSVENDEIVPAGGVFYERNDLQLVIYDVQIWFR